MNNFEKGRQFTCRVQRYLKECKGHCLEAEHKVTISVNTRHNALHKFDLGSDALLVECKSYSWLKSGGSPSAKFSTANEAMLYFSATSDKYNKMLFLRKTDKNRAGETLAEHYVRRYCHLFPDDVEIFEMANDKLCAKRVYPPENQG